jgi:hypothetical protein
MAERAERLEVAGLRWSVGAPQPILLATEREALLAFYLADHDIVDGQEVRVAEFAAETSRCSD